MALQLNYQPKNLSQEFPEAYVKVNFIQVTDSLLLFVADIFPNQAMRSLNMGRIDQFVNQAPDSESEDKVAVIYEWLKTQPAFSTAIDV